MTELEANFDRRVSDALMSALSDRSALGVLIDVRDENPTLYDIVLVRDRTGDSRASLYVGLTKVLDVRERRGRFWLTAHKTYTSIPAFDPRWKHHQELSELAERRRAILDYLREATETVAERYMQTEGAVQGLLCSGLLPDFAVISREAEPSYRSQLIKDRWTSELGKPLVAAVEAAERTDPWWPGVRDDGKLLSFGQEADVLAVSGEGDLMVIEVKPANAAKGLVWAPAQVRFYADVFARLLTVDAGATDKLSGMLQQRRSLGLTPSNGLELRELPAVIPVLAIGAGKASQEVLRRIPLLASALPEPDRDSRVETTRVWKLDSLGELEWQRLATDLTAETA